MRVVLRFLLLFFAMRSACGTSETLILRFAPLCRFTWSRRLLRNSRHSAETRTPPETVRGILCLSDYVVFLHATFQLVCPQSPLACG